MMVVLLILSHHVLKVSLFVYILIIRRRLSWILHLLGIIGVQSDAALPIKSYV